MDKIAQLSPKDRSELFKETAAQKNILPAIIEKDFWVCWVLSKIFSNDSLSKKVLFKGGTSLSKAFGIIERFSEDIDLILDWDVINDSPLGDRSKTKQLKRNKEIIISSRQYIINQIMPEMKNLVGHVCDIEIQSDMPDIIKIQYPDSFSETYLRPEIHLEIGPLALVKRPSDHYRTSA